jgi:methylglyoxal synthase
MQYKNHALPATKAIALVAHDNKKKDMLAWCAAHKSALESHTLYATGTTGSLIERDVGLSINKLISGPMGGDQQVGALISQGEINFLVFFWDPFEPMPHDPDVKALLRIAAVWNIPVACNQISADFLLTSPMFTASCDRTIPDYASYLAART